MLVSNGRQRLDIYGEGHGTARLGTTTELMALTVEQ